MSDSWWDVTGGTSFGENLAWMVTYRVDRNCIFRTPRGDAPCLPGGNRKEFTSAEHWESETIGAKAWGQGRESLSHSSREDSPYCSAADLRCLFGMNPGLTSLAVGLISVSSVLLSLFGAHHKIFLQCPSWHFPA